MSDFLKFIDNLVQRFPVHVEIYYSTIMDWCIHVTKVGCASDYPESPHDGDDAVLCDVQGCDIELVFAEAHVKVKEWLLYHRGGY